MLCWVTYFEPILELIDSDATQSDTRKWEVQHLQPQAQYIATMIVASFATSALSFNAGNNLSSNVVLIGLGGGSLSMFLREKFTMVRLRWHNVTIILAVKLVLSCIVCYSTSLFFILLKFNFHYFIAISNACFISFDSRGL